MADVFYVSITGLQLKRVWHAPTFWRHAAASMSQAKAADECLSEGAHLKAMKAFKSFATGKVYGFETATVPEWAIVHTLWLEKGRQV